MKHILKNFRTTVFGGFPGLAILVAGLSEKQYDKALYGAGLLLVALFASDAK
jgi:hypothetical protein